MAQMSAATALASAGFVAHNLADLPGGALRVLLAPETWLPLAVTMLLFAWWWRARSRPASGVFLAWALLQLLGGGMVSVLPLPFLPFQPAQTPWHYGWHAVYVVTHVPLVALLWRGKIASRARV